MSADDLTVLNLVLVEYLDKLKEVGLTFETSVASKTAITKKRVVECLQQIHQHDLANILSGRQGGSCKYALQRLASYPGLPMFFNVDFSRATLRNMGRPGYEASQGSLVAMPILSFSTYTLL